MVFNRFAYQLTYRLAALFTLLAALAWVLTRTDFVAVAIVLGALAIAQAWQVIRFVNRTNDELTRFLEAIRYDDFSQSFAIGHLGETFVSLKSSFEEVMQRFRDARAERETQRRYLEALVEHVPVAILVVHADGRVSLLNNAARRLLDEKGETKIEALSVYGQAFQRDVGGARSGERTMTRTELDGVERQLILSSTQITVGSEVHRVISLQDIQSELEATELAAWQDMVRVLSHEIGNSITPIASLARTADDMVVELREKVSDRDVADELISDIHDAVDTIARRSESLMRFVQSYRQLKRLPPAQCTQVALDEYFPRLDRLLSAELNARGVALHVDLPAKGLSIAADESLLDQAIINIVRNAADAALSASEPCVWLQARLSERGRPLIEISDNGQGLDEELAEKIFLPFFTTKTEGSGIGLALARQVMSMHKGAISPRQRVGGGALFQLSF